MNIKVNLENRIQKLEALLQKIAEIEALKAQKTLCEPLYSVNY